MDCDSMIGKTRGEYTIQKNVGKGTFGQVYQVTRTDQMPTSAGTYKPMSFAMKVISVNRSNSREEELLGREIQILSDMKKFKHDNIVQYVECFHLDCYAYIIMEYCEGGTLFEYIRKNGVVPEHTFVDFVRQIASGLEFLHSKHVLHRDVKSKNILITGLKFLKIADFGVAREIPVAARGTMSVLIGSPQYMSPEMLAKKPYDEKTDIWSLGCTCFEMGTGDYAFKAENIQQIRKLVENKQLPPMENADYCDETKGIIMCMLQTDSVNRPTAKSVFDSISCHKCKNTTKHSTKEMSKVVATVPPRKKQPKPSNPKDKDERDSGVSSDRTLTRNSEDTIRTSCSTMEDTLTERNGLQQQSNRYQAKIVRLMGDHKASEHVTKILRVCHKYPTDYDKIKATVKKYVKEEHFTRVYPLVLALKGVDEAIYENETSPSTETDSSGT